MFDLEQALEEWREQMVAAGIQISTLDELESHLREDIEEQRKSGLSVSKAFAAAVQRIGRGKVLNAEFAKGGGIKERWDLLLKRLALGCSCVAYGGFKLMWIHAFLESGMSLAWRLAGWADIALTGLVVVAVVGRPWNRRMFSVIASHRSCLAVAVVFGLVAVVGYGAIVAASANIMLPYLNFTQGAMLVLVAWYFTLLVALSVVLAGMADAVKFKHAA